MKNNLPCFLDFEASGMNDYSYPIEVAWSSESGDITSHLVTPRPGWSYWSDESELIHGIKRDELFELGASADAIAAIMQQELKDKIVYCDALNFDRFWLDCLLGSKPSFVLRDARLIMKIDSFDDREHRAAGDVQYLMNKYKEQQ